MAFKMLLIKGAKPVGAAVLGFAAYKGYDEWQKASLALKISKDKTQMEKLFDDIDVDKSGSISSSELQVALEKAGYSTSGLRLKAMMYAGEELPCAQ